MLKAAQNVRIGDSTGALSLFYPDSSDSVQPLCVGVWMAYKPTGKSLAEGAGLAAGWRATALALVLFGILLVLSGLPSATVSTNRIFSHTVGPLFFLLIATLYAWRSSRGTLAAERRFWLLLCAGYGTWGLTYVPSLISRLWFTTGIDAYLDFGFALSFLFVIAATEERPDDPGPLSGLARPSLWHSTVLIAGFFCSLILLPALLHFDAYSTYLSSYAVFGAMDLVVAARFFYFVSQSDSPRWRLIYSSVGSAFFLMFGVDLATGYSRRESIDMTRGAFYDAFWTLPFFLMAISAASGLFGLDDRRTGKRQPTLSDAFAASTLTWALIFPSFHFIADRAGWLDPALAAERDLVVIVVTLLLLVLALFRQRSLEQGLGRLVLEQRDIEANLRSSEKDLRLLIERGRVTDRLRAAEERFTKAFEVSPDALILSTFDDGTILDVNLAFEKMSQLRRADCIGQRSTELGLWPFPERRARMTQLLLRREQLRDLPGELNLPDGGTCSVRASYERIQEPGGDLLLTVLRENESQGDASPGRICTLLENARLPLYLLQDGPEGQEPTAVFVNGNARLSMLGENSPVELVGPAGLRLLLHFPPSARIPAG